MAADLLARILSTMGKELNVPNNQWFGWTDPVIVLAWLGHSPASLQVFQANQVGRIMDILPRHRWRHVRTRDNPADLASRGTTVSDLSTSKLWWEGPGWLFLSPDQWPYTGLTPPTTTEGLRPTVVMTMSEVPTFRLWEWYSSFKKLKRITAWVIQAATKFRNKPVSNSKELTAEKLEAAERLILYRGQHECWPEVWEHLNKQQQLPRGHLLSKYHLRIHDGLIRLRGRVRENEVIPLRLSSTITRLIVSSAHNKGHPDTSTLIGLLGRASRLKSHVKGVGRSCVTCQRVYARPITQPTGDLPIDRTTPALSFTKIGVDLTGPLLVTRGNPQKPM